MRPDSRSGRAAFLAMAFGWSWACWVPAALAGPGFAAPWVRWLTYAGTLGPAISGVALVYRSGDQARRDYWTRVTDLSRIRARWLPPILLLYPLATSLALLLDTVLTGIGPNLRMAAHLAADPWSLVVFPLWVLLLGPLPEELGWRGYALDRLQRDWSPLMASLILGLIWALWHLPLFFVRGSYQFDLGFGSPSFWAYCVTVVELSVLFTWIYNGNDRSILAAILFHFVLNFTGALARGSAVTELARAALLGAAVALVVGRWLAGARSVLRRR